DSRLGSQFVFRLPDGRYRMFYNGCDPAVFVFPCTIGVLSETSSDGLTFVRDPGLRLVLPHFEGCQNCGPICSAIVKLPDGRYRMYCSREVTPRPAPRQPGVEAILSAVSSDLYTWTPDPGIRIGPGAPRVTGFADHPAAVTNPD